VRAAKLIPLLKLKSSLDFKGFFRKKSLKSGAYAGFFLQETGLLPTLKLAFRSMTLYLFISISRSRLVAIFPSTAVFFSTLLVVA
jgi:hypothetical protein